MHPKQVVLAVYPKAVCTKSYTRKVIIDLGETAYNYSMHMQQQVFEFSYGSAVECWDIVAESIGLYGMHKAKRDNAQRS